MGFTTRKRLHRHWKWHHGADPIMLEVAENMELIKNPPPVAFMDEETKKAVLSENRKKDGIHIKVSVKRKRRRKKKEIKCS